MNKVYGYCRISRATQNIERQVRNITAEYPQAVIVKEAYTGTKIQGRKEFEKILKVVKEGDTIVFDSVSRMSRNADEGVQTYMDLMGKGVDLVFIKEPTINTVNYRKALSDSVPMTGTAVDCILEGINQYLKALASQQIRIAFEQAQKEVDDLHNRTKEGIETARLNGKQIGGVSGKTLNVKKKEPTKELIKKYSKSFNGTLTDLDAIKLIGIDRKTYYKYKKEIEQQLEYEAAGWKEQYGEQFESDED